MLDDTDIEKAKDFFNIRFWGAFAALKYGSQYINEGGSVTLMSGSFGHRPGKGYSLGAAVCGMMDAFTRAMAVELAPLRVNNIAAGVIKTNLWNNLSNDDREGEDIAQAFVYLMKQRHTTGQSLIIDGGSVLV